MKNPKIGDQFLKYYRSKDFKILESAPLLHPSFPMTFNMSAGLLQLDPLLKGKEKVIHPKLAIVQNCFRHFDLDKIGDHHHLSFFQMAGAFELLDFNQRSILEKIWEFLVNHLNINSEQVWVTVFKGEKFRGHMFEKDKESLKFWKKQLPQDRIIEYGSEHNFWQQAGGFSDNENTKLCGVTTEIFYDLGKPVGCKQKGCKPGCSCGRFLEISNNLFIKHFWDPFKQEFMLLKIPATETVIGVERVAAVVEEKNSVFETAYCKPLMESVLEKNKDGNIEYARIICDHIKALVFLFSEGAPPPGRNGRERIVRKLIRNLLTKLILMQIEGKEVLPILIDKIISIYPDNQELKQAKDKTLGIIYNHEKVYLKTLASAKRRIAGYLKKAGKDKPTKKDQEYFREHFGIPIELQSFYHYV